MGKYNSFLNTVDSLFEEIKNHSIGHLFTSSKDLDGSIIQLNDNREIVNFSSCSYLGLEFDSRLIDSSIEALNKYGTQFSSSRKYISLGMYESLENSFNKMFDANCIVVPTTTLGHISAIPVIVNDDDAVIIDQQVHNSVQLSASLLNSRNIHSELVKHNNMADLEKKIINLKSKYKRIWYLADGIYSMFGDVCPVEEVNHLLNKYEQFHIYIDDAHGMSWYGKNGTGYFFNQTELTDKMVLAVSLNKSFACGGGLLVFKDPEMERRVRNLGGPLIFSGPLQPAILGAAIASQKIHMSSDIEVYQEELWNNILYAKSMIRELDLPCISHTTTPVFFIGVSSTEITYKVISDLINEGHYVNLGIFPAVPLNNTGIRFTITRLQSKKQIKSLLYAMKRLLDKYIEEHDFSYQLIHKAFRNKINADNAMEMS